MSIYGALGVLIIVIALPLLLRLVPPNRVYGFRVPATLADRTVWYEANARWARDAIIVGVLAIVLSLGVSGFPPVPESTQAAVFVGGILFIGLLGWWRAFKMLHTQKGDGRDAI